MKFFPRTLAVVPALVLLAAGCRQDSGAAPASPASPTPPPAMPEELRLVPFAFGGPLFQPETRLRLARGARIVIPVVTNAPRLVEAGPGVSILVRTDAPQAVLSVSPSVNVLGSSAPGLVEIQALQGTSRGGRPDTYRVWLETDPADRWAPGWGPDVDETPLRIAVVEPPAPAPRCGTLELTAEGVAGNGEGGTRARLTFGSVADDFRSGTITLAADHPETSLSLLSRYRMPYADLDPESDRARVRFHLYPTSFAFGLGLRETPGGFEQTMSLGWFDELHLRAEAPGCEAVELSCGEDGQCFSTRMRNYDLTMSSGTP